MNRISKTLAALMAASLLLLSGCYPEQRNLTDSSSTGQTRSAQTQSESFSFSTEDMKGNEVTMDNFAHAKVVMFNMWEPWCGPCRSELPDLQKLYDKYQSEGLVIVGVFSDEDGVSDIVSQNGITYPMIRSCAAFDRFQSGYVPTTFFTDGQGNVLSDESVIGSNSYGEWESIILSYLNR